MRLIKLFSLKKKIISMGKIMLEDIGIVYVNVETRSAVEKMP